MGRIGKSYPRFVEAFQAAEEAEAHASAYHQALGAIIGVLCALGFIGWVLTR